MNDFGNVLFFAFLFAIATLTALFAYRKARGLKTRSMNVAIPLCLCAYVAALVGVSLNSETRTLALGADKCFDDWCATVISARSLPKQNWAVGTKLVAVTLNISNHARRAAFRPSQPRVTLVIASGDTVTPSEAGQREFEKQAGPQEALTKRLGAGDRFQTTLIFTVTATTREASVVLLEGSAIVTRFLVGDENSFFHRKMVYPITVE